MAERGDGKGLESLGELPTVEVDPPAELELIAPPLVLALVRNVARTAPLRSLLDRLDTAWAERYECNQYQLPRGWDRQITAAAEFLGEVRLAQAFPALANQRVRAEAEIGELLIQWALRDHARWLPIERSGYGKWWRMVDSYAQRKLLRDLLCAIVQPCVSVFEPEGDTTWQECADRHVLSNALFVKWAVDDRAFTLWRYARMNVLLQTCAPTLGVACKVTPSLLKRDTEPPRPRPFTEWEIHQLESALELHRKARHSERQTANAIAQALGPRLPAAVYAWDQVHAKVPAGFLKRMRGHLAHLARREL